MFILSQKSFDRLRGVHNDLQAIVIKAINLSEIDFGVSEGVRTLEKQKEYVAKGVSWTLDSRHITGHAVDLVAYISGSISWEMKHYALIAEAMLKASQQINMPLRWGAVWDKYLHELDLRDGLDNDIDEYVARFKAKNGKKPHLDGPHFELPKKEYLA